MGGWEASRVRAVSFVQSLTLDELVNMTTGAGIMDNCVGNTGVRSFLFPTRSRTVD